MVLRCFIITTISFLNLLPQITTVNGQPNPDEFSSRVCIIGAGYSGLAAARYMKENNLNFRVFEAATYIGGNWKFDPRIGTDEFGVPILSSQYKNLRVNAPREVLEFKDFPFPEETPSFPSGHCFYKYLTAFAKHFDLMQYIELQRLVTWVQWTEDKWSVTYMKTDSKENVTEECDFVVVASGEFTLPHMPYIQGLEEYTGIIMHSHDYKDNEGYQNQRVLLIGAGSSGFDLAVDLANITSKLVHSHHLEFLHHSVFNQPYFHDNYIKKPDLKHFTSQGAVFEDDSEEEFDIVIFCTGFKYHHTFLNHLSSGLTATQNYVMPLYRGIVNINQPSMTVIGVLNAPFTRCLDVQAEYSAALAAGRFELPSQDEMLRQWFEYVYVQTQKGYPVNSIDHDARAYLDGLHMEAGIQSVPPVFSFIVDYNVKNILEDFLQFRDYDFKIISDTQYEKKYNPREETCPIDV